MFIKTSNKTLTYSDGMRIPGFVAFNSKRSFSSLVVHLANSTH